METEKILGNSISNLNYKQIKEKIIKHIEDNEQTFIIAMNPEKILKARNDDKLQKILDEANYLIPDGIGVVIASKLQKGSIKTRLTGIDCMTMLCELSNEKKYKIFMYGAKPEVVKKAKESLELKYPNINITGYIDGYEKNNDKIIEKIKKSKANIVFVALGSPKQEYWIKENMKKTNSQIFMGVGGSFDVLSGRIKRAPNWMQKCGLEWLYRLIKEPKRIFRQIKLFKFITLVIKKTKKDTK